MPAPTFSEVVCEYLRQRVGRDGSQAALAAAMGVARQQVSASLRGERGVTQRHLDRLVQADGGDVERLLRDLERVARALKGRGRGRRVR